MITPAASLRGSLVPLSHCSSCCDLGFKPSLSSSIRCGRIRFDSSKNKLSSVRLVVRGERLLKCRATETEAESDDKDEENKLQGSEGMPESNDSCGEVNGKIEEVDSRPAIVDKEKKKRTRLKLVNKLLNSVDALCKAQEVTVTKRQEITKEKKRIKMLAKLLKNECVETKVPEEEKELSRLELFRRVEAMFPTKSQEATKEKKPVKKLIKLLNNKVVKTNFSEVIKRIKMLNKLLKNESVETKVPEENNLAQLELLKNAETEAQTKSQEVTEEKK